MYDLDGPAAMITVEIPTGGKVRSLFHLSVCQFVSSVAAFFYRINWDPTFSYAIAFCLSSSATL